MLCSYFRHNVFIRVIHERLAPFKCVTWRIYMLHVYIYISLVDIHVYIYTYDMVYTYTYCQHVNIHISIYAYVVFIFQTQRVHTCDTRETCLICVRPIFHFQTFDMTYLYVWYMGGVNISPLITHNESPIYHTYESVMSNLRKRNTSHTNEACLTFHSYATRIIFIFWTCDVFICVILVRHASFMRDMCRRHIQCVIII